MPLHTQINNSNFSYTIWEINADLESYDIPFINNSYFQLPAHTKKEVIVSRWLLWKNLGLENCEEIHLTQEGKPFLKNQALFFSLSHSGNYVLLLQSNTECGADIQIQNQKLISIRAKYLSEKESDFYNKTEQFDFLHQIWTMKEAGFKAMGGGFINFKADFSYDFIEKDGFFILPTQVLVKNRNNLKCFDLIFSDYNTEFYLCVALHKS